MQREDIPGLVKANNVGILKILKKLGAGLNFDLSAITTQLTTIEGKIDQINQLLSSNPGGVFPNSEILSKIQVDNQGNLYYAIAENPDDLKESCILVMLGSLNDESGYGNIITPTPGQSNPVQVAGIDNKPALSLITNQTQLSIPNIPSLLGSSTGATLYAVFSNSISGSVWHLIKTNAGEDWWRYYPWGHGYISTFRNSRLDIYPSNMPAAGNFCVSIHSRSTDYELFINNTSQGIKGGDWFCGDRFIICPSNYECLCNLSLLLVVPFWVDKNSPFHSRKLQAIKDRFPSLPFVP